GVLADADARGGHDPEEDRRRHQHPREDGVSNGDVRDVHGAPSALAAACGACFGLSPPARAAAADAAAAGGGPPARVSLRESAVTWVAFTLAPVLSASAPCTTSCSPALTPERTSIHPSLVLIPSESRRSWAVSPSIT